jgi:hypothetical protein
MDNYQKYSLNINFNQIGGSYIINSAGISDAINTNIIKYPEVSFLLKNYLGAGGSGSVSLAEITECKIDPSLNGKKVAIKTFNDSVGFSSEDRQKHEKNKLLKYQLDRDGTILITENLSVLYFDIKSGPLKHTLVYEYGGDILSNYVSSPYHNDINNKRILLQLFTILRHLTNDKNNMHNDLKCENIVYLVDEKGLINIQLIDFGASFSIDKLRSGEETLIRRTNMNSPEAIKNYLLNNTQVYPYQGIEGVNERDFSRWYYYPFISILFFLYIGKEYSTGPTSIMKSILNKEEPNFTTMFKYKIDILSRLLNNDFIKKYFIKYPIIQNLINTMCKPIINERMNEDEVLAELNKL